MNESKQEVDRKVQDTPKKDAAEYRKPALIQVGSLRDVLAKSGRRGDHDDGTYFGR